MLTTAVISILLLPIVLSYHLFVLLLWYIQEFMQPQWKKS